MKLTLDIVWRASKSTLTSPESLSSTLIPLSESSSVVIDFLDDRDKKLIEREKIARAWVMAGAVEGERERGREGWREGKGEGAGKAREREE